MLAGNEPAATAVDSGSFGIFVGNKRTATEKFSVEQGANGSLVTTDFKSEESNGAHQTTELKLSATGDLRRYEFKDIAPGSAQAVLEPKDEFMVQHSTLLPTTSRKNTNTSCPPRPACSMTLCSSTARCWRGASSRSAAAKKRDRFNAR